MSVNTSSGRNTGGFNAGATLKENGESPGFMAFSLSQAESLTVTAYEYSGAANQITLKISRQNGSKRTVVYGPVNTFSGVSANTSVLEPGFYIVSVYSPSGTLRGKFGISVQGNSFVGGVNIGGWIDEESKGFGAFYVPSPQEVDLTLLFGSSYGSIGSGMLLLDIYYQDESGNRTLYWSSSSAGGECQ